MQEQGKGRVTRAELNARPGADERPIQDPGSDRSPADRPGPGGQRDKPRLLCARGKLSGRAGRAGRCGKPDQGDHLPPRGGRGEHGGSLRQAHRTPGGLHGHPRPRRHPRQCRRAYGAAGFHADAAAGGPGGRRRQGPRRLPGDGLPGHVRLVLQMAGATNMSSGMASTTGPWRPWPAVAKARPISSAIREGSSISAAHLENEPNMAE